MTIIYAATADQVLTATILPKIAQNGVDMVRLHVDFDSSWDALTARTAVFTTSKSPKPYEVVLSADGDCLVPAEVLTEECKLYITVKGENTATGARKPSTRLTVKVLPGTPTVIMGEPTPSVYQQLLNEYAVLRARMSGLEAGGTVEGSEVIGIRTGADGTEYDTAGDAVRAQINKVDVTDKVLRLVDFSGDSYKCTNEQVTKANEYDNVSAEHVRRLKYTLSSVAGTANYSEIVSASDVARVKHVRIYAKSNIPTSEAYVAVGANFNWSVMATAMVEKSEDFICYTVEPVDTANALRIFAGLRGGNNEKELDLEYYAVVEWKTDKFVLADHAKVADNANKAEESSYAKHAGITYISEIFHEANNRKGYFVTSTDGNKIKVQVPSLRVESGGEAELWLYGLQSFKVTDLLGKGVSVRISVDETNNSNDTVHMDRIILSTDYKTWGTVLKRVNIAGSVSECEIDLDECVPANIEGDVYINVCYEVTLEPTVEGTFVIAESNDITISGYFTTPDSLVVAGQISGKLKRSIGKMIGKDIVCWGDSLTAQSGWTEKLQELSGMTVHNAGTGGENARTIMARQGADVIMLNGVTIPAGVEAVTLATYANPFKTSQGHTATPLLQGGAHVNPVKIGGIEGTLKWTGSSYNDTSGKWTFTRSVAGERLVIDRPTAMTTAYDREKNNPHLMVIFMGQNGGYDNDNEELVNMHRLMIQHAKAKHVIVLGLSSGSASSRAAYETAMRKAFGRYFISLREYLSEYGLADAGLTATSADTAAKLTGTVPPQLLADSVHYTSATKTVIGNLIYKRCCELGIFEA